MKSFPILVAGLLLCAGCGHKEKAENFDKYNNVNTNANAAAIQGEVEPIMTARLKQFVAMKGRLPGSFLELVGATGDVTPRVPDGCAFQIDPTTVEVKIVKR